MKITAVQRQSPLFGRVSVGSDLVRINGHRIADEIDFRFHSADEPLTLELIEGGQAKRVRLESVSCGDLGVEFEKIRIKVCRNKCLFCFVDQQPRGLRRSLYIKDDDYLYSFTHGNFISLSRLSDGDFDRIVGQRLSPLYISVHATDDRLRRRLFGNEKLEPIKPRLEYLVRHGIVLHTQTVICPGINDGMHLEKTIDNLAALAPGVASLAVVPVGLTRYRRRLAALRLCTRSEAQQVVDLVAGRQKRFKKSLK